MTVYELIKELEKCDGELTIQMEIETLEGYVTNEPTQVKESVYLNRKYVLIY